MATGEEELSIQLFNYLCNIIGSRKVVKKRREIFSSVDCVVNNDLELISSGSKAEGLDLKGSDVDVMRWIKEMRVYENDNDVPPSSNRCFIMDTDDTKPGFALLRRCPNLDVHRLPIFGLVAKDNKAYLSNKLLTDTLADPDISFIHGPCVSTLDESLDIAVCLGCQEWISPAKQWISRPRNNWPNNTTIRQVVDYGVLFVPIGCKGSPNEDIEWRISFSVAEKHLIYSFNHVQFLCYALLKITLNDVIKKKYTDLLCSYFLKTIMFWVSEEKENSFWKPENFLTCFMTCFKRLVYCVEYKTCLHYFIPENNFFANRFSSAEHKGLLSYLRCLNNSGWSWLLHTDTIQSYNRHFYSLPYTPVASSFQILGIVQYLKLSLGIDYYWKAITSILISKNDMFIYLLSSISQIIAQTVLPSDVIIKRNKQHYYQYRHCRCHLLIGLNNDAVSGWLLLASLFYSHKQYRQCISITEYCLSKCTPDKILLCEDPDIETQSRFERFMHTIGQEKFVLSCKHCLIDPIVFTKPTCIIPSEIRCLLEDEVDVVVLPSVVFAHLLKFLSFNRLGNRTERCESLRDLKSVIMERNFILEHSYCCLNSFLCLKIAERMVINRTHINSKDNYHK